MSLKVVNKLWGKEIWLVNNERYCSKYLIVKSGFQSSRHRHPVKDETFTVIQGLCELECATGIRTLAYGDSYRISPGEWHRFRNQTQSPVVILETSTHHDDADVERSAASRSITRLPRNELTPIFENAT